MKVDTNGVKLNVEVEGREGAPWLTFSNSLATDLSMWDAQVAALKDRYRILRYDKRGHGKSDAPKGPYDLPMLVKDVIGLWDHFGVRRSHFVGISIGGMTALGLGIDYPDRVISIAPCDCRADSPPDFRDSWDPRIAIAEGKEGTPGLVPATLERWFAPETRKAHPERMDYVKRMICNTTVTGYVGCGRALQAIPYLPRLGQIKVPTLFLAGTTDVMLEPTRELHKRLPGSFYVEIGPAGHLSNLDQPDLFSAAIGAFMDRYK
jgi:3-oxoadipate enol-lactonase